MAAGEIDQLPSRGKKRGALWRPRDTHTATAAKFEQTLAVQDGAPDLGSDLLIHGNRL